MANEEVLLALILEELRGLRAAMSAPRSYPAKPLGPQRPKGDYSPAFEAFWKEYPQRKRMGKMAAYKSWLNNVPKDDEGIKKVMDALSKHKEKKDWLKEGGQFIPMPTTWLNQHRWEDAVEEASNDIGKYGRLGETI